MTLLQVILGLILGYLLVTLTESFLHEHVHHACPRFRLLQKKYPCLLKPFWNAYRAHAIVHHRWTYHNHVTLFCNEPQKKRVEERLRDPVGKRIIAEGYGATLGFRSAVVFMLPILPPVVSAIVLLPWPTVGAFSVPVAIYPLMSKVIHPYLHEPYHDAINRASSPMRWILSTRYIKFVWCYHWMHHRYPQSNFNLILGGDWFRGKCRIPSTDDFQKMGESGIPVNGRGMSLKARRGYSYDHTD